tara:strand:+ start:206 stop:478 length:273 start_codon:yes stop_codon:yes gene_type:complete
MEEIIGTNRGLNIIAAYGIVQVLAQDLGIKTGKKQRDFIQNKFVQIIVLFAGAYVVTDNYRDAAITTFIYYFLKYGYSNNETSPVCFESV